MNKLFLLVVLCIFTVMMAVPVSANCGVCGTDAVSDEHAGHDHAGHDHAGHNHAAPKVVEKAPEACGTCPSTTGVANDKAPWYAGHKNESWLKKLDPMVDNAVAGYNAADYKVFYKDYAKSMAGVATEMAFNGMVKGMWIAKTGKIKSREIIDSRCSFNDSAPLVVYKVETEKGSFVLPVNFIKEGDAFKVMQIQIMDK